MEAEPINWVEVREKIHAFLGTCGRYKWGIVGVILLVLFLTAGYLGRASVAALAERVFTQEVVRETETVEVPATSLEERYAEVARRVSELERGLAENISQSKAQREAFEHAIAEVAQQNDVLVAQSENLTKALAAVPGLSSSVASQKGGSTAGGDISKGGKLNINTASAAQLDALPGIGPSYAERIVAYRTEHGSFQKVEDIQNVPGIGPATFAKIADAITV